MTSQQQTLSVLLGVATGLGVAGNCCAGCPIHVPADFPTIQAAIDAGGCEIIVAPGTYNEIISNFWIVRSSDGPDVTIIDGKGFNFTVVTCTTGCGTLEGFTITGGNAPLHLGGGWYNQNASPTIINCKFDGNAVMGNGAGGAMRNSNSHPTLIGCTFTGNTAANGGAIFNSVNSFPTITACFFGGNSAGTGQGGAIYNLQGAYPVITDSLFCENTPNDIVGPYDDGGGNDFAGDCDLFLDCNENGIFDWIEIKKGLAQDVNNNGIPDDCECVADLSGPVAVPDGVVDAFDLAAVLGAWCSAVNDPNPPSPPCENCLPEFLAFADLTGPANAPDGCVDAFDLAKLLAAWGACK